MILPRENRPEGRGNKNCEGEDKQRKWILGGWGGGVAPGNKKETKKTEGRGEDRIYRNEKHRMREWNMAWNKGRRKMRGEDGWNREREETRSARWTNAIHLSSCPAAGRDCSARAHARKPKHTHTESASPDDGGHWYCNAERRRRGGWVRSRLYWKEGRKGGGGGTRGAVEVKWRQEAFRRRSWLKRGDNGKRQTCVTPACRRGSSDEAQQQIINDHSVCGQIKLFNEEWTANDSSLASDTGLLNDDNPQRPKTRLRDFQHKETDYVM